jgi:hypothetical protein
MMRFKDFLESTAAAPATGGAAAPTDPNKTFDISVADREFDIDPATRDRIDVEGEMLSSYEPLEFPGHGIRASAPMFLRIDKKFPDGSADVTVMYSMSNRQKLRNPDGTKYNGAVKDIPAHIPKAILDRIRLRPFDSPAASATPPPGGPPTMGGM